MEWFAVSDLHGKNNRFDALFRTVTREAPPAVLIAGDILPRLKQAETFLTINLFEPIAALKNDGIQTRFVIIMGNDDARINEPILLKAHEMDLIDYIPLGTTTISDTPIVGYPFIHPSPFLLKDWELYDVSRYVDPGCVSPLEGSRTIDVDPREIKYRTIKGDLEKLTGLSDPKQSVYLFHSPPYDTDLDLADIGGQIFDHVPLDPHIGSIAVKKFIEKYQPPVTIHGHVHESFDLTGKFFQRIGNTLSISACGKEKDLVLVRFDPEGKEDPEREIIGN